MIGPALAVLLAFAPADDKPAEAVKVAGVYDAAGEQVGGKKYTATVRIEKSGDAFKVEYEVSEREKYVGVGLLTGRVLSVAWLNQQSVGVLVYEVQKDGTLLGKWTALGDPKGQVFKETLTKKLS